MIKMNVHLITFVQLHINHQSCALNHNLARDDMISLISRLSHTSVSIFTSSPALLFDLNHCGFYHLSNQDRLYSATLYAYKTVLGDNISLICHRLHATNCTFSDRIWFIQATLYPLGHKSQLPHLPNPRSLKTRHRGTLSDPCPKIRYNRKPCIINII